MGGAIDRNTRFMGIVGEVCREAARLKNHLGSGLALEQHEVALFVEFAGFATWQSPGNRCARCPKPRPARRCSACALRTCNLRMPSNHIQQRSHTAHRRRYRCGRTAARTSHARAPLDCAANAFVADSRQIGAFDISENHGMSFLVANPKTTHYHAARPL